MAAFESVRLSPALTRDLTEGLCGTFLEQYFGFLKHPVHRIGMH